MGYVRILVMSSCEQEGPCPSPRPTHRMHDYPRLGEAKTPPLQSNFGSFSGSGTSPEKQQEAMERAMGVAMGMLSPFAVAPSHGGGDSGDKDDEVCCV